MTAQERTCPGRHDIAHPAPALRPDEYLCRGCVRHAERALGDLPALVADIEVTVSKQDRAGGVVSGRSSSRPLPVNLAASAAAREALELLFEWVDFVARWQGVRGLPAFAQHLPLQTLTPRAVAVLLGHSDWLRTNEQGPDLANAIGCVRRDLRRLVDRRVERLYAGPCKADLGYGLDAVLGYGCRLPLYREWGRDGIRCDGYRPGQPYGTGGCGTVHAVADRRLWLRAEVEEQLLPLRVVWEDLHELAPGHEIDWAVAKRWTQPRTQRTQRRDAAGKPRTDKAGRPLMDIRTTPPRLEPQAWLDGVPLYRGADIMRLVEDKGIRRGRRRVRRAERDRTVA